MSQSTSIWKKFWPLAVAQFFGVFNDHAFRAVAIFTVVGAESSSSENSAFISIITMVYALPFILFPSPAGYFADRFSKRNVIVIIKFIELFFMLAGTVCLANFASWGSAPLALIMFLLAAQSAFFSPVLNGILPETFGEKTISHVNGNKEMLTMVAVIMGMCSGIVAKSLAGPDLYKCGLFLSCFSFAAFIISLKIIPGLSANPRTKWSWNWFRGYIDGFKLVAEKRAILLCVLGDAFFTAIGTGIQALLIVHAKYALHLTKEIEQGFIQLMLAFGVGFGCYLAGKLSGKKIELGLVPFGAIGIVLFIVLMITMPGSMLLLPEIPKIGQLGFYPFLLLHIFLLGISGGLFMVPLRAYIQNKTEPDTRGTLLANANVLCFGAMIASGFLMLILTGGTEATTTNDFFSSIQSHFLTLSASTVMIVMGIMTVFASIYACVLLPEFMLRFFVVLLTSTVYRIKLEGEDNIPDKGPALLVANHVSFVDGLLITSCTSRFVRFLMYKDYYTIPYLSKIFGWYGFIEVPAPDKPKKMLEVFERTKKALRNGDVVCIFPEGKITRNGVMDEFKEGFSKMIPEELDVPVIPVRLGMLWGSIFSYYYGKIKLRMPMEFPHPASVTIGKPVSRKLDAFELRKIMSELAAESESKPRDSERPLHYQFAKYARFHPFQRILYDANGKSMTNFSVVVRAAALSGEIRKLSAENKKYVGVLLPNTVGSVITTLAVMMSDKVPAMLNYTASPKSMDEAVRKAELDCILTSRVFIKKAGIEPRPEMIFLEDVAKNIPKSKVIFWGVLAAILPHQELMNILAPETHRNVFATAVLLFSSGSTGSPKGVMLSHRNISSNVYSFYRIVGWDRKTDSILGNLPLFHSFGITACFWVPLMTGTKVVYVPNPLDATATGKAIQDYKIKLLLATPTFLQMYMKKCTSEQFKSLRLVVVGAEKLRIDISKKFNEMTGLTPLEGYGCTELSPVVSLNISNSILSLGTEVGKPGSVGMPMPGICVRIVDPQTRKPLPPNTEGLMLVRGPNVMQGYLNDPEKTAEVIKDGWYNTGDIAKVDTDDRITITGRLSRFSKIAGEMVPHELVEDAIQEILDSDARLVAVSSAPDEAKGEKLIVFHTEMPVTPEEIIKKLREADLPNLWIPKAENFRKIEAFPILGSGKLDLAALKKMV
ncbi:MAG TPA: hypothetical protein DET40_08330 [Lentisphaeria bacterium]|nr:MAG: hypothetical protein A2X45_25845 [Lentisphaerae bacterium GWF2_50_93]HCE43540.1 hypothetical protein [Lentisphaeria bacterium]